jgi:hypothetical protein
MRPSGSDRPGLPTPEPTDTTDPKGCKDAAIPTTGRKTLPLHSGLTPCRS